MRVLFVSGELIGSALVHRLISEGHELKLYIDHIDRKECFEGLAIKVDDWKSEVEWVGKDGLIVFDDVIFNGEQDKLREDGYSVIGGSAESDKLEHDRQFFQETLRSNDIQILPSFDFSTPEEASDYVKENLGPWVVKQDSHIGMLNYVGERKDSQDVLDVLKLYKERNISPVHLQKRVLGVEIGVARYFNGNDWIGPIEINLEHKRLCNDDVGPLTAEMGTLMWYTEDENTSLYKNTLSKIKNYLQSIDYKGDVDINCIVNEGGIWPLEATMRFGTPSTELQCELHKSPWGEFMKAVADGRDYDLDYHRGYGIVIAVAVPPFPYAPEVFGNSDIETSTGVSIFFKEELTDKEKLQIHTEEASVESDGSAGKRLFLAGKHGYALYVTGHGDTVEEAQKEAYGVVDKLILPKMFYRTDIGNKFIREDYAKLKKWNLI